MEDHRNVARNNRSKPKATNRNILELKQAGLNASRQL